MLSEGSERRQEGGVEARVGVSYVRVKVRKHLDQNNRPFPVLGLVPHPGSMGILVPPRD